MSDRAWLILGFTGLLVAIVVLHGSDADAGRQPRSQSSGLFTKETPVRDPNDSAETYRLNQQATSY